MYAAAIHHSPRSIHGLARHLLLFVLLMLAAMQATAGSLALAWDPVNDPRVAGYKVHYGTTSGNYTAQMDAGNVTTSTVPNLADGATYYFAVTAYDGSLVQSGFSNEVAGTVPAAPVGAPVANFTASTTTGTAPLAMNFTSTSTGSITTYAWTFGDGTNSTSQNPIKTYSTAGSYTVALTVTGPGGVEHQDRSQLHHRDGGGRHPGAERAVGTRRNRHQQHRVSLTWNASTDNVGVTGYQVFRCDGSTTCTNFDAGRRRSPGRRTPTPASNGGTIYRYAVKASDAAGNISAFSTIVHGDDACRRRHHAAHARRRRSRPPPAARPAINLSWTASDRQRRRHRLPRRTLRRRELHELRADRHVHRDHVQQHRPHRQHHLSLSR